jgi:23S rRNA pseudouridine955/2504/2580 synthase
MRLDRWFKTHFPEVRHGELEKLLRTGQVRVGGGRVKANRRLQAGDEIRVPPLRGEAASSPKAKPALRKEDSAAIQRMAIYEDDFILALNKPAGLAVQGGEKTSRHVDGMLASLEGDGERPRLVHRLDRDTSGLLILAKSRAAAAKLAAAFQGRDVDKTYWALVAGSPRPQAGVIDLPLAKRKSAAERGERVDIDDKDDAKRAITDYQLVEEAGTVSFLALRPLTGRTHQLRVHCAAIGAPIVGDGKYGGEKSRIEGVAPKLHLFCREMTFPHPGTGKRMTLKAPLQGHMLETWRFFDFDAEAKIAWPEFSS